MLSLKSKKILQSRYLYRIIMRHVLYIVALIIFISLALSYIPYQINQYAKLRRESGVLDEELVILEKRNDAISKYNAVDVDELIVFLNDLFPSIEDRFSIFSAVDNLEIVTETPIVSYSSPFEGKVEEGVKLSIQALADESRLPIFLRDYPYLSGRLITLERFNFDPVSDILDVTAAFHSKDIPVGATVIPEYNDALMKRIIAIKQQLEERNPSFRKTNVHEETIPVDYSPKQNPFE